MLEVHRVRSVDWKPTAVVALATSIDESQVAVAREDGSIEIWIVAPGSVGWHCQLTIPGRHDSVISSLIWCRSSSKIFTSGRLFSAGLDGSISEWDLCSLQQKTVIESFGGSIWQMAAEPLQKPIDSRVESSRDNDDNDENATNSGDSSESDSEEGTAFLEQRVAIGCDDGSVRIYIARDTDEGMAYFRSFPRVKARILSIAWSLDAKRIFAGGSDGCIRCWNVITSHEMYRITAGHGGLGGGSDLCIWSLLVLRDGTVVSGDSAGGTQFWDIHQGTLLQSHTYHKGDVLALVATPSHHGVFSAGSDGQVIHYKFVSESIKAQDGNFNGQDLADGRGDRWVFVGSKRAHTHDVRALTVAVPMIFEQGELINESSRKKWGRQKPFGLDYQKWARPGVPMLISGGDDTKLFAYPANKFLDFHPHDICPAPQRSFVQLACKPKIGGGPIMMTQYSTWLDVSMIHVGTYVELGKRKSRGFDFEDDEVAPSFNECEEVAPRSSGWYRDNRRANPLVKGTPPKLLARLKCKASQRIICSAMSETGHLVAFSDRIKPSLYELKWLTGYQSSSGWEVCKKQLPPKLSPAHSMVFSADSTRLLIASYDGKIYVVDVDNVELLHTFDPFTKVVEQSMAIPPITRLYTSVDGQWLAAINCCGDICIFNLEILRQHWQISRLDGAAVTAAGFHPSNRSVLVVTTSSNHVYVLDVDAKQLGEWSKRYTSGLPRRFLEFPGGIIGLSFPPSRKSTSVIIHSSRAMCLIDFVKPVKQEENDLTNGASLALDNLDSAKHTFANGDGKLENGKPNHKTVFPDNNFVIVPFRDPVLFLAHLSEHSILVVEKPWVDVLQKFRAPVYRHLYGT